MDKNDWQDAVQGIQDRLTKIRGTGSREALLGLLAYLLAYEYRSDAVELLRDSINEVRESRFDAEYYWTSYVKKEY